MNEIEQPVQTHEWCPENLPSELAGATLMVDLRALQHNWRHLRDQAGGVECAAAVKADAYGVGLPQAAEALWAAGCRTFFVALPAEGRSLRAALPEAVIYLLNGLLTNSAAEIARFGLRPVLASPEETAEWAAYCRSEDRRLPAAIHIDSGINRLGLTSRQVEAVAASSRDLDSFRLTLVMSHLACGDVPNHAMNREQIETFERLRGMLPAAPASIANSAGTLAGPCYHYDLVRPGIALYGGNPFVDRANAMKPVVSLYGRILQVRELPAGTTIGYGATWRAPRDSVIAVIGAGYADGYFRSLSGTSRAERAHVYVGGQFAPVVGRVSMDMMTVDVTDVPPEFARRGGCAELIGTHVTVDDLARWAGTIPYEILTGLGSRFARIYSPRDP